MARVNSQGAGACGRQTSQQSAELLAVAEATRVVSFTMDPSQALAALSTSAVAVQGHNVASPVVSPALPISYELRIAQGQSATISIDYNLLYQTINAFTTHTPPTAFEGAPFMIQVQPMVVDVSVVPQTTPPTLIASGAPEYHLLPFSSWQVDVAGLGSFSANGRLQIGPFNALAGQVFQQVALVWVHAPADWNVGTNLPVPGNTDLGGWTTPAFVSPFTSIPVTIPMGITFDARYGILT